MSSFVELDLYDIAREVIANQLPQIEARQQIIELRGQPTMISGDRFALEILIQNLLTNASKFTPDGGSIMVSVAQDKDCASIEVMDSGPGIDKADYERVFDRFYRVGGDRHSSNAPGCGLGLAIVEHIVRLHGAEVTLADSTFSSGLSVKVIFNK